MTEIEVDFDDVCSRARKLDLLSIEVLILIARKGLEKGKKTKPIGDFPHCPRCTQALNTKVVRGKHIAEYCKCCGQAIDWDDESEEEE